MVLSSSSRSYNIGIFPKKIDNLDEVLNRDMEGKINWLVSNVSSIENRVSIIESNHLTHIERDIQLIKKVGMMVITGAVTVLTGINFM